MASLFSEGLKTKTEVICAVVKYVANPVNQSQLEEITVHLDSSGRRTRAGRN